MWIAWLRSALGETNKTFMEEVQVALGKGMRIEEAASEGFIEEFTTNRREWFTASWIKYTQISRDYQTIHKS